jgi:DNA-binding CsgD family transcriptional regulator
MASKGVDRASTTRSERDQEQARPAAKLGSLRDCIPFQVADRNCWAVRARHSDPASEDDEHASHELGPREVSGWLRLGDKSYVVMVEREAGERLAAEDEAWEILSERETQIAVLVSRGKGTKQIAGHLRISEHTVRSYMRRIFSKLHVSNRPAMVAELIKSPMPRAEPPELKAMEHEARSAK